MIPTIQRIKTTWTKASRGAPESARRAAVPDYFPIPPVTRPHKTGRLVIFKEIGVKEWEDFTIQNRCEVIELAGCLIFNGRFGGGGGWTYHRQVFSIACSLDMPAHDRFAAKPDFAFSDEQDLR